MKDECITNRVVAEYLSGKADEKVSNRTNHKTAPPKVFPDEKLSAHEQAEIKLRRIINFGTQWYSVAGAATVTGWGETAIRDMIKKRELTPLDSPKKYPQISGIELTEVAIQKNLKKFSKGG